MAVLAMTTAEQHLATAAAYIAVAESGDAKRAAYEAAADAILAAQADDATLTQAEVGRQLGKSRSWVVQLLAWRRSGDVHVHPFAAGDAQQRYRERQVPTRHDDRVEMAATLLADPTVVEGVLATPSVAQRHVENAVHEREVERRQKGREVAQQQREDAALPLPAHMAAMVLRLREWASGLAELVDDLDDLPEGRARELVGEAAAELEYQAGRWRERLHHPLRVLKREVAGR